MLRVRFTNEGTFAHWALTRQHWGVRTRAEPLTDILKCHTSRLYSTILFIKRCLNWSGNLFSGSVHGVGLSLSFLWDPYCSQLIGEPHLDLRNRASGLPSKHKKGDTRGEVEGRDGQERRYLKLNLPLYWRHLKPKLKMTEIGQNVMFYQPFCKKIIWKAFPVCAQGKDSETQHSY